MTATIGGHRVLEQRASAPMRGLGSRASVTAVLAAGTAWVGGPSLNQMDETFALTFTYSKGDITADPNGDAVFANLPAYFDDDITILLLGRDTPPIAPPFEQWVWLNGKRVLDNSFAGASYGRYTPQAIYTFHFRMER